jgi:hypothetical protein
MSSNENTVYWRWGAAAAAAAVVALAAPVDRPVDSVNPTHVGAAEAVVEVHIDYQGGTWNGLATMDAPLWTHRKGTADVDQSCWGDCRVIGIVGMLFC